MPITPSHVTPYSSAGQGLFPGWTALMERSIGKQIVEVWPDQAKALSILPRENVDQRQVHWQVYTNRTVNSTPQAGVTDITEHTPLTWEGEWLENVTTTLKSRVQVGLNYQNYKKNYVPDLVGKNVRLAIMEMMRGVETNIWSGEYNNPTSALSVQSAAGLGVTADGTGIRPVAGTKWTTDVVDANSRMTQRDHGGAAWDYPEFLALLRAVRLAGGVPRDVFVDSVNKEIASGFYGPRDRVQYKGGEFRTESQVELVATEYGEIRLHLVLHNYPSRAVFALDIDPLKISWGPVKGLGIQTIPMARRGDYDDIMARVEYTLCPKAPHAHGVTYDTAA